MKTSVMSFVMAVAMLPILSIHILNGSVNGSLFAMFAFGINFANLVDDFRIGQIARRLDRLEARRNGSLKLEADR